MRYRNRAYIFFMVMILTAGLWLPSDTSWAAKIEEGAEGLPFSGTNFITNQPFDLNDHLKKRVILLDFGSIYCSSCMVTVPNLIKLSKEYSEEDLALYNIYLDIYNPQRVIKFFKGFASDLKFTLLIDNKLKISRQYGVDTLPTTIIIDKNGIVRRVITGYTEADEKEISKLVDDLVRELPTIGVKAPKPEQNLVVFTPESFTKTNKNSLFVVGYLGGAGVKDVTFRLNNLPARVTKTDNNMFHMKTSLSLAMNLIEVQGQIEEDKVKRESLVIFREPKLGMQIKSELPEYKFHVNDEKSSCVKCHKLTLSPQEKESQQSTKVCLSCHGDLTDQIYVHGPISVGGCLPCHDYMSFPVKYDLRARGVQLCFTCHEQMSSKLEEQNVHGPVAARVCVVCHDPHGSPEKFLLEKKLDQQCISCHQDTLRDYAKAFIHTPVRDGRCTGCHDPHASRYKWFLRKERNDLCTLCHKSGTYTHTHKVGGMPDKEITVSTAMPDLDENGCTICVTCHFVHAGDYENLAKGTPENYCNLLCH